MINRTQYTTSNAKYTEACISVLVNSNFAGIAGKDLSLFDMYNYPSSSHIFDLRVRNGIIDSFKVLSRKCALCFREYTYRGTGEENSNTCYVITALRISSDDVVELVIRQSLPNELGEQMDLKDIKRLIDLVDKSDLSELVIEEDGAKISLRKGQPGGVIDQQVAVTPTVSIGSAPIVQVSTPQNVPASKPVIPTGDNHYTVESPMVGSFYRAPSEGADAYVQVGDKVKKGQVVCIVEAMKLMNEIETEHSGTIESILVDNAQPIEFGEPLFVVKKDE